MDQIYATGRRKTSTARVFLRPSSSDGGNVVINKRKMLDYFPRDNSRIKILSPLELTSKLSTYDVYATVKGGGTTGQAEAVRHGIARALRIASPDLGPVLRKNGLLTRDSRMVERKKVGLHKARRATQFSKR